MIHSSSKSGSVVRLHPMLTGRGWTVPCVNGSSYRSCVRPQPALAAVVAPTLQALVRGAAPAYDGSSDQATIKQLQQLVTEREALVNHLKSGVMVLAPFYTALCSSGGRKSAADNAAEMAQILDAARPEDMLPPSISINTSGNMYDSYVDTPSDCTEEAVAVQAEIARLQQRLLGCMLLSKELRDVIKHLDSNYRREASKDPRQDVRDAADLFSQAATEFLVPPAWDETAAFSDGGDDVAVSADPTGGVATAAGPASGALTAASQHSDIATAVEPASGVATAADPASDASFTSLSSPVDPILGKKPDGPWWCRRSEVMPADPQFGTKDRWVNFEVERNTILGDTPEDDLSGPLRRRYPTWPLFAERKETWASLADVMAWKANKDAEGAAATTTTKKKEDEEGVEAAAAATVARTGASPCPRTPEQAHPSFIRPAPVSCVKGSSSSRGFSARPKVARRVRFAL